MAYILEAFDSPTRSSPAGRAPQAMPGLGLVAESRACSCGRPCPEPFLAYTTAARSLPCQLPLLWLSKEGFHAILSTRPLVVPVRADPGAVPASRGPPLRRGVDGRRDRAGLRRRARVLRTDEPVVLDAGVDAVGLPGASARCRLVLSASGRPGRRGLGLVRRAGRPGHGGVLPRPGQAPGPGHPAPGVAGWTAAGRDGSGVVAVARPACSPGGRQHQHLTGHSGESKGIPAAGHAETGPGLSHHPLGRARGSGHRDGPRPGLWPLPGQEDRRDGVVPAVAGAVGRGGRGGGGSLLLFLLLGRVVAGTGGGRGVPAAPAAEVRFPPGSPAGGWGSYSGLAPAPTAAVDDARGVRGDPADADGA